MKNKLLTNIKKYETIIIHRHQRPDGDALGSQFGLKELILSKFPEKKVLTVGNKEEFADNSIKYLFKDDFDEVKDEDYEKSLVIIVDTANVDRIQGTEFFRGETIFKIDHHVTAEEFGHFEWIEDKASSTCEMITRWARENKIDVSKKAAEFLLAGMITDTGRFQYNSVKPETIEEALHLMKAGAKIFKIVMKLNDRDLPFSRLQGHVLTELEHKNGVTWYMLPKGLEKKFKVPYSTASSLVFILMSFKESNYAAYLSYDSDNKIWKGSLRSRKKPINQIAEMFDGGGHEMAAGFKLKDPKQFKEVVEQLKKLNNEK